MENRLSPEQRGIFDLTALVDTTGYGARAEAGYRIGDNQTLYAGAGIEGTWKEPAPRFEAGVGYRVRF